MKTQSNSNSEELTKYFFGFSPSSEQNSTHQNNRVSTNSPNSSRVTKSSELGPSDYTDNSSSFPEDYYEDDNYFSAESSSSISIFKENDKIDETHSIIPSPDQNNFVVTTEEPSTSHSIILSTFHFDYFDYTSDEDSAEFNDDISSSPEITDDITLFTADTSMTTSVEDQSYSDENCSTMTTSAGEIITTETDPATTPQKEAEKFYELKLKYQALQIEEVRLSHIIHSLNEKIREHEQKTLSLQREIFDKSETIKKFELMENEFLKCQSEVKLARNIKSVHNYGEALEEKLKKFDGIESLRSANGKTIMSITSFIVENDENSVNILSNRELPILPLGLGKLFPNISELHASCGLIGTDPMAFEGLTALKTLNFTRNNFTEIENGMFEDLINLNYLDLSKNQISILHNGSFYNLHELKNLNLAHNHIETFPLDIFGEIGTLEVLILSFNRIRYLDEEFLSEINLMQEFHCDHNQLVSINPNIIGILESVYILDLSSNICIDEKYPETTTMVSLALKVSQKCRET